MLTHVMEYRVLAELDHGLVAHKHGMSRGVHGERIADEPSGPYSLARSDVLSLTGKYGHHLLLLRLSGDWTLTEEEDDPCRDIVDQIIIVVAGQGCVLVVAGAIVVM